MLCDYVSLACYRQYALSLSYSLTYTYFLCALFVFICLQRIIIFNRTQFKFVKKSEHDLPLPTPHAQQCCQISFANRFLLSSNYIYSIHNLCWYVCTYEFTVFIHVCTSVMYLCFCKCGVCVFVIVWVGIGLVQLIESNWKTFHVKTCLFVCLCMYVHA